ncbi:MAG: preprotein translocase subunit SecE [Bacteroidales bacterium]|nr:preprotein translocase subunit SecE [Bacteroidales bacterium]
MKKIKNFLKESFVELTQKVTWPSYEELRESSIVVLVASFLIALVIFIIDISFSFIIQQIYNLFN